MADPFFGLELVHVAHREALQRPADAAMLFVHWTLASSGLQAEHPAQGISNQSASSEVLPPGWADQEGVYELSYVGRDRSRYLVKALVVEGQLITNMSITQELVEALAPGFRSLRVQDRSPRRGSSQERRMSEPAVDPLRVPGYGSDRHSHPLAVGGADLDPLGRGLGGGMLMDPRRPPVTNLPPGVPPGARFDPFGPPGLGPGPGGRPRPRHPGEPDPDHLRMPGSDYDNMFM
ncbi:Proteasome inhibitor PI31 subunit [Amphibalanus amphitrite]|uniref:Proteasome inhibitor PI31 subunit n=1 Tax=Amphibalanus amphitrite TaxID=1232801 RepID=A0A6A4WLN7_AMPAM|nr:Proteasome inhibitor PI31 subunit [Amphibalanus amphitrite]KAF0307786.1 Proteasome inhibitor PI31 subunit [Amphibalanus amphitrite]